MDFFMNQLPGVFAPSKKSREKQLELLREKLTDNNAFKYCRRYFRKSSYSFLGVNTLPSKVVSDWSDHGKSVGVMLSLLAKLRRDGHEHAYSELYNALVYGKTIEGESFPLDQTTPVTAVIFDPYITLPMIIWGLTHSVDDLEKFARNRHAKHTDDVLSKLYSILPDLEENLSEWEKTTRFSHENRFQGLMQSYNATKWWRGDGCLTKVLSYGARDEVLLRLYNSDQNNIVAVRRYLFGMLLHGERQNDVLGCIPRDQQHRVATWRFDIPTLHINSMQGGGSSSNFSLCIHPEDEHEKWKTKYPSLVSKGFQHGFGAIMLPRDNHVGYLLPKKGKLPIDGRMRIKFDLYDHSDDGVH